MSQPPLRIPTFIRLFVFLAPAGLGTSNLEHISIFGSAGFQVRERRLANYPLPYEPPTTSTPARPLRIVINTRMAPNVSVADSCESMHADRVKPYPFTARMPPQLPPEYTSAELIHRLRDVLNVDGAAGSPQVWGVRDDGLVALSPAICAQLTVRFKQAAVIFNGAVKTNAIMLVQPRSTVDVSKWVSALDTIVLALTSQCRQILSPVWSGPQR